MSKAKKQKPGNEKYLKEVGTAQLNAAQMFEPAHQAVIREANADQSGIIRARAAGSVWQGLAGDMGSNELALGMSAKQPKYEGLAESAVAGALRGGTNSAQALHDDLVHAGATSRLANAQVSGRAARDEARTIADEQAKKVQAANEWRNSRTAGLATLGGLGIAGYNEYRKGQQDAVNPPKGLGYDDVERQNVFYRWGFNKQFNRPMGLGG